MKKSLIFLFGAVLFNCFADTVVVRRDFEVPSGWRYPQIQGRDFWFMLPPMLSNNQDFSLLPKLYRSPSLQKVPVFRDAGLAEGAYKRRHLVPENFVMKDLFYSKGNPWWNLLETHPRKNVPLMLSLFAGRPSFFLREHYRHDQANYQAFLKRHPNLYMFNSLGEWDNELVYYDGYFTKRLTAEQKKQMLQRYPSPKNRYEHVAMAKKIFERGVNFHFDDRSRVSVMRAGWSLDHLGGAFGAKMLSLETTNTAGGLASYRWQTSGYFIRGAARQFKVPWMWYVAHFCCGYDSKGKWQIHYLLNYAPDNRHGTRGPFMGPSPSNLKRVNWMTWLYGASFYMIEGAVGALTVLDPKTGLLELSQVGKDLNELYLSTRKIDRGVPYTPVALLTPFAQGYPQGGGRSWSRYDYEPGDMMIDAFTFSIVPPGGNRKEMMKKGIECTLFNTPYAAAYDVLVPDSPQKPADFVRAASAYKAAFLTGFYKPGTDLETVLSGYVENGGTLFVNVMQIPGFLSSKLTGVKVLDETVPAGKFIVDETGRKTPLKDPYRLRKVRLAGAKPWLKDENGNILAVDFRRGKGKVIVTTPEWMTPPQRKNILNDIFTGKQQFEFIKYLLDRVESEVFPVKARIPVQYGINKTRKGWLLWLINNQGVYKFVDQPAVIKPEERIIVPVELKSLTKLKAVDALTGKIIPVENGVLKVTVEPGDLRLISLVP